MKPKKRPCFSSCDSNIGMGTLPCNCRSNPRYGELDRPIERIRTQKVKDVPHERSIRLYCAQFGAEWNLQIRAPMSLGSFGYGGDGRDFIVATAPLSKEDMRALRAAIDKCLEETT